MMVFPSQVDCLEEKKIALAREKSVVSSKDDHIVIANYWRDKIRDESKQIMNGKWLPLRFIFTQKELVFFKDQQKVKTEKV